MKNQAPKMLWGCFNMATSQLLIKYKANIAPTLHINEINAIFPQKNIDNDCIIGSSPGEFVLCDNIYNIEVGW
jgi:hypothetical protein